ncbi:MAG: ribosomal RNA small subunit methyltransferase A [Planctomycetes bacterium]|nr:ribosomal RNA small subunit methyltransferase A [Planctomycetota bacterium]
MGRALKRKPSRHKKSPARGRKKEGLGRDLPGGRGPEAGLFQRLKRAGLVLRPSLGQHFLTDRRILEAIAAAAQLSRADRILEVGTGAGTLTRVLAERAGHVVTLEVDERLVEFARQELAGFANVRLLSWNLLDGKGNLVPEVASAIGDLERFKLVANLPYQIATPLLLNLFSPRLCLPLGVVTLQKELADRLSARPGTKDYGPATLILGYWAEVEPLWTLPPGAFRPPPQVTSRVVRLRPRARPLGTAEEFPRFCSWVKRLFSQRRKQIGGRLREFLGIPASREAVQWMEVQPEDRPEDLPPEAFMALARKVPQPRDRVGGQGSDL